MRELVRTNDAVVLSFIQALLNEREIEHMVLDSNMSIMEGSLGILPRRILVSDDQLRQAVRVLRDAGLENEISGKVDIR